jgi:hypothetical protein
MNRITRTLTWITFALVLPGLCASSSHKNFDKLAWQGTQVKADGKPGEWPDPLSYLDEKTKLSYQISNDLRNLYICMRVTDAATKIKIIRSGMEFRIDTLGKKAFPVAFLFPLANQIVLMKDPRGEFQPGDRGDQSNRPVMKQKILSPANTFQLAGFKQLRDGSYSLIENTTGITSAIAIDSLGALCYEAVIPFSTFFKDHLDSEDTARVFAYKIIINGLPTPTANEPGGTANGMGGNEGGAGNPANGMGGNGMHSGQNRGGGGRQMVSGELFVTDKITRKMRFSVR